MFKIKIAKNGPYIIKGLKKLVIKESILNKSHVLEEKEIRQMDPSDEYYLCRCGQSDKKPFCDGSHIKNNFNGDEIADKTAYINRSKLYEGDKMQLLDDERCAFARFCHRERGEVWTLTENSDDRENMKEAVEGASACPAGRLTAVVNGELIENHYEDEVAVFQDPQKSVSAGLNIKGDFLLEGGSGYQYEKRNRLTLCRCGHSRNKPFCDATHVSVKFNDGDSQVNRKP